jgi:hypothetical protein
VRVVTCGLLVYNPSARCQAKSKTRSTRFTNHIKRIRCELYAVCMVASRPLSAERVERKDTHERVPRRATGTTAVPARTHPHKWLYVRISRGPRQGPHGRGFREDLFGFYSIFAHCQISVLSCSLDLRDLATERLMHTKHEACPPLLLLRQRTYGRLRRCGGRRRRRGLARGRLM